MALRSDTLERCGVPAGTARAHLPLIKSAMREFEITTPERARMFLAQVLHESMRLTRFEEIDSGTRYEGNKALGNTEPGDGPRFKGRGPIQITGRWNYTHFGKLVGVDLVRRPALAAVPRHGWRLAAAYFEHRGCNKAADRGDFAEVTRLINPGMLHLEERKKFYELLADADVVPGTPFLSRGDKGEGVLVMTRRLAAVRSKETGSPYLDGERNRFDESAERALRSFQEEHGLKVDGRYGPKTLRALARASRAAKASDAPDDRERTRTSSPKIERGDGGGDSRKKVRGSGSATPNMPGRGAATSSEPGKGAARPAGKLPALVAEVKRLDAETERAWQRLVTSGARLRSLAAVSSARGEDLTAILLRIEKLLGRLVDVETGTSASLVSPGSTPGVGVSPGEQAMKVPPSVSMMQDTDNGAAAEAAGNGAGGHDYERRSVDLEEVSERELRERIERLERARARYRAVLIRRYLRAEELMDEEVKQ